MHAADWDRIRALHVSESEVEAAMRASLGPGPFRFRCSIWGLARGAFWSCLTIASSGLARYEPGHARLARAELALGLRAARRCATATSITAPADGVAMPWSCTRCSTIFGPGGGDRRAARVLAPGGRLLIVDFAPHSLEFLREVHAHVRLGFATGQVRQWLAEGGARGAGDARAGADSRRREAEAHGRAVAGRAPGRCDEDNAGRTASA